ncbi:hypothetical protein INP82_06610 [Citrobacter sedlakii]|uniref:hypothetical protein n=1 Tax=Citrobacter TaxID=544 RepID=UPI001969BD91|nr:MULTISPECIES: hypothetical protein [Citrobacter]MBM9567101.1 hypothetical protein [Citrobacter sedlakii]HBL4692634.1 hypothetical protein [Citrobacter sedlakii]HBL4707073.1 hypothetical protein [Citrobacter sedlakii]HBL4718445.1 hypothetical protein [Citrobacter sedlakii]HCA7839397.1 hypothetical protein [Citrobacter sedlakii]
MLIFELTKPGSNLNYEDRELSWKFERLLSHLETAFYDANVALNLFNGESDNRSALGVQNPEQWQNDFQKRQVLEQQVRNELGIQPYEGYEEVRFEVDARLKRDKWRTGDVPLSHEQRIIFLHAKSFLYALDTIDKFIKVISEEDGAPAQIKQLLAQVANDFPHLRAVRNSAQHLEDRARGLGAGKVPKPLKLQPVDNGIVVAPQGALMLNNLFGTKLGYTMADGHHGEVDVSEESMLKITSIIQEVFNSFPWVGPPQLLPS